MAITNQPNNTYVSQYIADGNDAVVSLQNLYESLFIIDENGHNIFKVPLNDFFIKYREQLKETVQLHALQQSMYYRPKSMSLELYGTTELWLGLLRLNGMRNITEFRYSAIFIYNPSGLFELINIFFKREGIQ